MALATQLPYEVLVQCFQAACPDEQEHGGELVRWASYEIVAPFARVCKSWTNREQTWVIARELYTLADGCMVTTAAQQVLYRSVSM